MEVDLTLKVLRREVLEVLVSLRVDALNLSRCDVEDCLSSRDGFFVIVRVGGVEKGSCVGELLMLAERDLVSLDQSLRERNQQIQISSVGETAPHVESRGKPTRAEVPAPGEGCFEPAKRTRSARSKGTPSLASLTLVSYSSATAATDSAVACTAFARLKDPTNLAVSDASRTSSPTTYLRSPPSTSARHLR